MVNPMMVAGGASVVGNVLGGKGARKAAKRQIQGIEAGMNEIRGALGKATDYLDPYQSAGQSALNPLMGALGIGGQTDTYQNPLLQQIQEQTLQRMMNRASATGRNAPADMANTIAQGLLQPAYTMQQNRIGQLQGLAGIGLNAATNLGQFNMNAGSSIANLQTKRGEAQAMKSAAPYVAGANMANQLAGFAGRQIEPPGAGGMGGMGGFGGAQQAPYYTPTAASGLNPMTFANMPNFLPRY